MRKKNRRKNITTYKESYDLGVFIGENETELKYCVRLFLLEVIEPEKISALIGMPISALEKYANWYKIQMGKKALEKFMKLKEELKNKSGQVK